MLRMFHKNKEKEEEKNHKPKKSPAEKLLDGLVAASEIIQDNTNIISIIIKLSAYISVNDSVNKVKVDKSKLLETAWTNFNVQGVLGGASKIKTLYKLIKKFTKQNSDGKKVLNTEIVIQIMNEIVSWKQNKIQSEMTERVITKLFGKSLLNHAKAVIYSLPTTLKALNASFSTNSAQNDGFQNFFDILLKKKESKKDWMPLIKNFISFLSHKDVLPIKTHVIKFALGLLDMIPENKLLLYFGVDKEFIKEMKVWIEKLIDDSIFQDISNILAAISVNQKDDITITPDGKKLVKAFLLKHYEGAEFLEKSANIMKFLVKLSGLALKSSKSTDSRSNDSSKQKKNKALLKCAEPLSKIRESLQNAGINLDKKYIETIIDNLYVDSTDNATMLYLLRTTLEIAHQNLDNPQFNDNFFNQIQILIENIEESQMIDDFFPPKFLSTFLKTASFKENISRLYKICLINQDNQIQLNKENVTKLFQLIKSKNTPETKEMIISLIEHNINNSCKNQQNLTTEERKNLQLKREIGAFIIKFLEKSELKDLNDNFYNTAIEMMLFVIQPGYKVTVSSQDIVLFITTGMKMMKNTECHVLIKLFTQNKLKELFPYKITPNDAFANFLTVIASHIIDKINIDKVGKLVENLLLDAMEVLTGKKSETAPSMASRKEVFQQSLSIIKSVINDDHVKASFALFLQENKDWLIDAIDDLLQLIPHTRAAGFSAEQVLKFIQEPQNMSDICELLEEMSASTFKPYSYKMISRAHNMLTFASMIIFNSLVNAFYNAVPNWAKQYLIGDDINNILESFNQQEDNENTKKEPSNLNRYFTNFVNENSEMILKKPMILSLNFANQVIQHSLRSKIVMSYFNFQGAFFTQGLNLENSTVKSCDFSGINLNKKTVNLTNTIIDFTTLVSLKDVINNKMVIGLDTIKISNPILQQNTIQSFLDSITDEQTKAILKKAMGGKIVSAQPLSRL